MGKNPYCYMPSCGIEGKYCPDCANYRPPVHKLFFATKDFFIGDQTISTETAWFIKKNDQFYLFDDFAIKLPKDWLRESTNIRFPTNSTLAFKLIKTYPGSQPKDTLYILSRSNEKYVSSFWRGGWHESGLGDCNLREWSNFFTELKHLRAN